MSRNTPAASLGGEPVAERRAALIKANASRASLRGTEGTSGPHRLIKKLNRPGVSGGVRRSGEAQILRPIEPEMAAARDCLGVFAVEGNGGPSCECDC